MDDLDPTVDTVTGVPAANGSRRPGAGRRSQAVIAGAGLLAVAALAFLAWTWRHPSAFDGYAGNEVGRPHSNVGETTYVGITMPNDQITGSVTIHGADPHGLTDSTGATFAYYLCTPDPGPAGSWLGIGTESDLPETCDQIVPATGAEMSLTEQQVIIAITPAHEGTVVLHGLDLHYSDGWQNGTQRVGLDVRIRVPNRG